MKFYYVYKLTDPITKEFYIGSRECKCDPYKDPYKGSMSTWKPENKERLDKEILCMDFKDRTSAIAYESILIRENITDPLNQNYHIPSENFHCSGTVVVSDQFGKIFRISINDELFISGEVKSIHKGTVIVKNKEGECFRVSVNDENYINGIYESVVKNKITIKDENGNCFNVNKDDPRYISGEFVPVSKGQVTVKDENGNYFSVGKNDPRYISGELVHNTKGTIPVKSLDGKIKTRMSKDDPRYISGEFVHVCTNRIFAIDSESNKIRVDKNDSRFISGEIKRFIKDILPKNKKGQGMSLKIYANGIIYNSIKEATDELKISRHKLMKLIKNDNLNYHILNINNEDDNR